MPNSASNFQEGLSAPALRALANAKIKNLKDLTKFTKAEVADLHGMGPKGIRTLEAALKAEKISFKNK